MAKRRRASRERKYRKISPDVFLEDESVKYFAYGSNLLEKRLKARVGIARFTGLAKLSGWALTFHFLTSNSSVYCDIYETRNENDEVWGAVFDIPRFLMPKLDKCEGHPYIYNRREVYVKQDGKHKNVIAYVGVNGDRWLRSGILPFDWYVNHVVLGAKQLGLPEDYQEKLSKQRSRPDPFELRAEMEATFWQ